MVQKQKFSFTSRDKRTEIYAVEWRDTEREPVAVLQLVHGMVEYIERYDTFAGYLAERGYVVAGHDHLGHGASVETQEDWGYFGEHPSDTLVGDIHILRGLMHEKYPGLPYFILGHSMGSYLLRKYLSRHGSGLAGAVVMGTGFVPEKTTALAMKLTRGIARVKGWHYRSALVAALSFGKPYRRYDLSGSDVSNSWLTKDEELVLRYYTEPRCSFTFTLNGYLGLFEAVADSCNQNNANRIPKELPILLVSGADDPVGDFGEGVRRVFRMYEEAGIKDVKLRLYEGDRHEILNELDREMIFDEIEEWLEEHNTRE